MSLADRARAAATNPPGIFDGIDHTSREPSILLAARVRQLLGGQSPQPGDVELIRGRYQVRVEDLRFALRIPRSPALDVELELLSYRCPTCAPAWAYMCKVVHSLRDVGDRINQHAIAHEPAKAGA